jgi:primosomal protein N' (replication factor Y)
MLQYEPIIVRVAIPSPLRRTFDYKLPAQLLKNAGADKLAPGTRVRVEFGRREVIGLVVESTDKSELKPSQLKDIIAILDSTPLLPAPLFKLFIWAANYYQYPIGEALFSALPTILRKGGQLPQQTITFWALTVLGHGLGPKSLKRAPKQKALINLLKSHSGKLPEIDILASFSRNIVSQLQQKGLIEPIETELIDNSSIDEILNQASLKLDNQQQAALDSIDLHSFNCYLLDGITGSGKTEIYLQSIEKTLRYGRQSLILIPEISLTPQTEKRFRDRFNVPVVTMHSGLTDKQRLTAWMQAKSGQAKIILGTRSAIYTPIKELGLIVLDEEHDQSYKQQEGFKYSARDLAVIRAQHGEIPIILGSATPSLESLNNCMQDRYVHLMLDKRAGNAAKPNWNLVDLKAESVSCGIADSTLQAIERTLEAKQQVLVFLNRRGFAPALLCHDCGWTAECSSCDSKLTVHRSRGRLICHHCDYQEPQPSCCPQCKSHNLIATGEGTERSEQYLQQKFPNYKVVRVDRDTTRKKGAMQQFYETADSGDPCILLGTQMLAKGHHFANVTLVAILDADSGLLSADFRSHERMGQLLTQVAGRSGRGEIPGQVLVQTHQPQHPLFNMLISQDYRYLAQQLLAQRKNLYLPPFRAMAIVRAESSQAKLANDFLSMARNHAEELISAKSGTELLGPLPALMEKRAGRYRYIMQVTANNRSALHQLLSNLATKLEAQRAFAKIRWSIDIDPQEL